MPVEAEGKNSLWLNFKDLTLRQHLFSCFKMIRAWLIGRRPRCLSKEIQMEFLNPSFAAGLLPAWKVKENLIISDRIA